MVATAPTVYGIETSEKSPISLSLGYKLQQHLPFTVLKLVIYLVLIRVPCNVATAPTVYGIETMLTRY